MTAADARHREALRQQQLLRLLWHRGRDTDLNGWLRESHVRGREGLAAYRGNAAAIAERALAAAYPTVRQLVGEDSFAQLARAHWHDHPPLRGDLAQYGAALAEWIAADPQLASEPYLPDVARIDWAAHCIESATDVPVPPPGVEQLASSEPRLLRLRLRPGLVLLRSRWPVVTIWQAHRRDEHDRMAPVRDAFAQGQGEIALVSRAGWRADVQAVDAASATFTEALQREFDLAQALELAADAFAFDRWLQRALTQQWLLRVELTVETLAGSPP